MKTLYFSEGGKATIANPGKAIAFGWLDSRVEQSFLEIDAET